ncbi:TPA: Ig-like domain-containing protein, partial [Vibrio vulnificus]|nr:Ig-like domain-containing protein [Vibrio vulnificus]HDY8056432.1 Ig-like domain-containing protein [Vibrio vulnificus]
MDFTAFLAGASLTAGRIVVLDLNGNIKILAPGQAIAPGELVIETLEETDVPQFRIATDAGETNITDDIQQIFAALEEGQDPTQLGDDFATAAGETGGSSLVAGGTISRTGAESLASTDFSTQGLQALGLSETQSLALANQLRAFNDQITIVEPTPDDRPAVSSISSPAVSDSSPAVSEGDNATFDVGLSNASTTATTVTLTLAGDSATAGTDFTSTEVTITYQDGTTQTVAVKGDGTFDVAIPAGDTTFSILVQTTDDNVFEGDETFTLSGKTATQASAVTGTATIQDGGNGGGENPDDDRPSVSITEAVSVNEGSAAEFTVSLSAVAQTGVSVKLTTALGSAESDDIGAMTVTLADGTVVNANDDGSYTIPAGQTELKVSVATNPDNVYEGDETFSVSVEGPKNTATGTATITDGDENPDDDRPILAITGGGDVSEGTDATFTVTLSNATEAPVVLKLATSTGGDYTAEEGDVGAISASYEKDGETIVLPVDADGNVTVPAGVTAISVSVKTTDDDVYEGDETFGLVVTESNGVTSNGSVTGTATIMDNDKLPTISVDAPDNTNDTTPTITGKTDAAEGSTVTIVVTDAKGDKQTLSATVDKDGNYSVDVTTPLAEGSYKADASVTDKAGNTGIATDNGSVDTVAPALGIELDPIVVGDDNTVNKAEADDKASVTLSGTVSGDAKVGDTITLTLGDGSKLETKVVDLGGGKLGFSTSTTTDKLVGGNSITAEITVIDAAGNPATKFDSENYNVDTTAVSAPTVTIVDDNNNDQLLSKGEIGNDDVQVEVAVNHDDLV